MAEQVRFRWDAGVFAGRVDDPVRLEATAKADDDVDEPVDERLVGERVADEDPGRDGTLRAPGIRDRGEAHGLTVVWWMRHRGHLEFRRARFVRRSGRDLGAKGAY